MQNSARVSPGQRSRILELRAAHLQNIEGIVRKRKDIVWELQQATVMPESASSRQTAFSKVSIPTCKSSSGRPCVIEPSCGPAASK